MRSLVYFVAAMLDGYIAGADRGDPDFFPFEGPHAGDLLAEFPEMIPGHLRARLEVNRGNQRFDTVLMGRTTYDIGRKAGLTSPYPHLLQIVVSNSITGPPDPAAEVFGRKVVSEVRALKAGSGKDLWLAGGDGSPRSSPTRSTN